MDPNTIRVLKKLERTRKEFFNIAPEAGHLLNLLIKCSQSKSILEVGTSNGYSTIWLAEAAQQNQGQVTTIEGSPERTKLAQQNLQKVKLNSYVDFKTGHALETIKKSKQSFDFLFLDATKSEYLDYLKNTRLKKPAIITADNVISHQEKTQPYLNYVKKNFSSATMPLGGGLEISYKK